MAAIEVRLEQRDEITLYGVWGKTNDKTTTKDIPHLSSKFHKMTGTKDGTILPFFVLSKNYDANTGNSELFIGSLIADDKLSKLILPCSEYAIATIKPKFGALWGLAIGEAKHFFYTKWLPQSDYYAQNLEYEYHTEKAVGKKPTIDIVFAICTRTK